MDLDELSIKMTSLLRKAGLSGMPKTALVAMCVLGVALLGFGAFHFWPRESEGFTVTPASANTQAQPQESEDTEPATIVIDVEGSVVTPGLYSISAGSRVGDAVQAAGGVTQDAAIGAVNLAQKLEDGEQVRIPSTAEVAASEQQTTTGTDTGSAPTSTATSSQEKVNINTASAEELQKLSGIGPSLSERIIDYRSANGRFSSVDDLKNVSGIGETRFANLKDQICV